MTARAEVRMEYDQRPCGLTDAGLPSVDLLGGPRPDSELQEGLSVRRS